MPAFNPIPLKPPLLSIAKLSSLFQDLMAEREIVPFGVDLNKIPSKEDALAIIPVEEPLPLAIIPPKEIEHVPPRRTYGQSYFAQACQPTLLAPQDRLLLEDASRGPKIVVPKDTKLRPPRPNERIMSVKTNKLWEVTCVKYTTATPHVSLKGIHASRNQVKFILPREAPKRSAPAPLEREAKRLRTTKAMLETKVDTLTQAVTLITSIVRSLSRQMEMNMLEISNLKK
jgi:hypothetical protein